MHGMAKLMKLLSVNLCKYAVILEETDVIVKTQTKSSWNGSSVMKFAGLAFIVRHRIAPKMNLTNPLYRTNRLYAYALFSGDGL